MKCLIKLTLIQMKVMLILVLQLNIIKIIKHNLFYFKILKLDVQFKKMQNYKRKFDQIYESKLLWKVIIIIKIKQFLENTNKMYS